MSDDKLIALMFIAGFFLVVIMIVILIIWHETCSIETQIKIEVTLIYIVFSLLTITTIGAIVFLIYGFIELSN